MKSQWPANTGNSMEPRHYQGQALRVCAMRTALTAPSLHAHLESGKGDGAAGYPPRHLRRGSGSGAYLQRTTHKFCGRGRFSFIDNEKKAYPLNVLCKVMQVSRSGYYRWKRCDPSAREQERAQLIPRVRGLHQESKAKYDSRRMAQELKALGFRCGQKTEKVQGDNRQQPSVARCPQSFESQIFRGHSELRLGWRHYLHLDLRGVVVLGGCD